MAARPALATAGCSHCRLSVLNLFAGPVRSPLIVRTGLLQLPQSRIVHPPSIRRLSSLHTKSGDRDGDRDENDEYDGRDAAGTPWYLQVDPPRHVASMEPPPLPEVPDGAPPIIASVLEYASDEMGLGELSLLDLRQLHPPPALGPNLFMLFGTARSERHLHVSAGRLQRWLRVNHRITANADGLLGPNERKRKLRRKARRAKLLGTMGTDDADDGISTGWVCVNLGNITRGSAESAVVSDDGRVAGFGVSRSGSTVVVQIMTEARRAEMGLETLWEKALLRSIKSETKVGPEAKVEKLESLHPLDKAILSNPQGTWGGDSSRTPSQPGARFYSTQRTLVHNAPGPDPLFQASSRDALGQTLLYDGYQKFRLLEYLQEHLNQLTPDEAQNLLGRSSHRQGPAPFLWLLELAMRNLPPQRTWESRLSLQNRARELALGSPLESLNNIGLLIKEMRMYGIQATRAQYLRLLSCIYSPNSVQLHERSKLAVQLLETMHQRGQSIIAHDILVTIIEATAQSAPSANKETTELIERLERLTTQARLPCMDESLLMRLMSVHAQRHDWGRVWDTWRIPPRYLRPRSAAMYVRMYQLAASSRSSSVCILVLRRCFQEMLSEDPIVQPAGEVLRWLMECVRIADPRAEELAATLPLNAQGAGERLAKREFVKLVKSLRLLS